MTLREIGQFLLELGKEFVEVFLWNINWLDANIFILILVCISYLLLTILAWLTISDWWTSSDKFAGSSGLARQLLRWFFGFWIFLFIVSAPIYLLRLLDIVPEEPSHQVDLGSAWFFFVLIYGFLWNDWGTRILDRLGDKLFGIKEIDPDLPD